MKSQRPLTITGGQGLVSLEAQVVLEPSDHLGLVIHDQDSRHARLLSEAAYHRLPPPEGEGQRAGAA